MKKIKEWVPGTGTGTPSSGIGSQIQRTDVTGSGSLIPGISGSGSGSGTSSKEFSRVPAFAHP